MYNLDEDQAALNLLVTDTHEKLIRTNSDDNILDHLNV